MIVRVNSDEYEIVYVFEKYLYITQVDIRTT